MSLNIKNERVHALAREAARRTGQNQTKVIEQALTRLLADLDHDRRQLHVDQIISDLQDHVAGSAQPMMHLDDLYGEDGLPA